MRSLKQLISVGVASNFQRAAHIKKGLKILREKFGYLKVSRLYKSADTSGKGAFYWNLVAKFESELNSSDLNALLKSIEVCCDRLEYKKESGRISLDLDLLVQEDMDSERVSWIENQLVEDLAVVLPLRDVLSFRNSFSLGLSTDHCRILMSRKKYQCKDVKWDSIL